MKTILATAPYDFARDMSEAEEFSGAADGVWSVWEIVAAGFWFVVVLVAVVGGVSALLLGWREGKAAQAKAALKKRAEENRDEGGGVAL